MCPAPMRNSEDMDTSRVFEERLYGDILWWDEYIYPL